MEIFTEQRESKRIMGRRNYIAGVVFGEGHGSGMFSPGGMMSPGAQTLNGWGGVGGGRLSLAIDYIVQGEGAFNAPTKYGPVVIPALEFGR